MLEASLTTGPAGGGEYSILVSIAPPSFLRHEKFNGNRYCEPVPVRFDGVQITPGRE